MLTVARERRGQRGSHPSDQWRVQNSLRGVGAGVIGVGHWRRNSSEQGGGGHHLLVSSFFPCNALRVNVKIPHSRGATVPPRSAAYGVGPRQRVPESGTGADETQTDGIGWDSDTQKTGWDRDRR